MSVLLLVRQVFHGWPCRSGSVALIGGSRRQQEGVVLFFRRNPKRPCQVLAGFFIDRLSFLFAQRRYAETSS